MLCTTCVLDLYSGIEVRFQIELICQDPAMHVQSFMQEVVELLVSSCIWKSSRVTNGCGSRLGSLACGSCIVRCSYLLDEIAIRCVH